MIEKSMYRKYKEKEITLIEYENWCAQQNGYKNYSEYKKHCYQINREQRIKHQKQYNQNNKKQRNEYQIQYNQNNKKQRNEYQIQYNQKNKEQIKQHNQNNKEYINKYRKQWYQDNPEYHIQYLQTPSGKISQKKAAAKRERELGYNVLNKEDMNNPEYEGHHMNTYDVLFIPERLHASIYHSVIRNINMKEINTIAIDWYIKSKRFVIQ